MKNEGGDWRVLDLTGAESKVLHALLEHGAMSVSKTARMAEVARTTVDAALRRLGERGLVRRVNAKGHISVWKAVRADRVKKELSEASSPFEREKMSPEEGEVIGGIDAEEIGISVFRGKRQILYAYEHLLDLSHAERFFFIQGNGSVDQGLKKIDKEYLLSFHARFKKAGIIMEGINGEHIKRALETLTLAEIESHFGRSVISFLLPNSYMDFYIDVVILRGTAMFIDLRAEVVVLVRHAGIVGFFNQIGTLLKDHGTRFDINGYLRELVLKRSS